jgi:hypothetical protein
MTATVLAFPTPAPKDGGARERNRARIASHRNGDNRRAARDLAEPICDLTMGSADPEDTGMPSDSPYHAPAHDGA